MFAHLEDTIVAISSAGGGSPRGVLRLSGSRAVEIASRMFSPPVRAAGGFRRYHGTIRWSDERVDLPAELYLFRSPRSFTRQDTAEIHTIGSPPVLAGLLDEMTRGGARLAEPGEFTGRALLAGALDLTSVEGIAAMIHAGSDAQLRAAEQLLHGTLATETRQLHSRLVDLLSLVEASIDFVEEPIDFLSPAQVAAELTAIEAEVEGILHRSMPMERLDTRYRVALLGRPNAGKSTLFNRLTGLDRAICSPLPGTTRDVIVAPVSLPGGAEAWLMDSAGVGEPTGTIEECAEELSRQAVGRADLVLFVIDGTRGVPPQTPIELGHAASSRAMIVINKIDLLGSEELASVKKSSAAFGLPVHAVSASTGDGCPELKAGVSDLLHAEQTESSTASIAINARHRVALSSASSACARTRAMIEGQLRVADAAEFIALELREAISALGAIVGEVTTEEVLGRIFSRFCIGK
jgi:tRNA modification GTPase